MIRLSGRLRSAMVIGGQGIRARKLRTLLSMVSLFLGVLAVVSVQAGAEIAERALLTDVELTTGRDGTLQWYLPPGPDVERVVTETLRGRSDAVAFTSTNAVIGEPDVDPVNPGASPIRYAGEGGGVGYCDPSGACYGPDGGPAGEARVTGAAVEVQLMALTGDLRAFRPFLLESGSWLDFTGAPSLSPRLVLNREAALALRQYRVPAELTVPGGARHPTPRIEGVVHDGGYGPVAYVRADELANWLPATAAPADPRQGGGPGIQVMSVPGAEIEQTLRARLVGAGVPEDQLFTQPVNARENLTDQLALMRWIFLAMAALVLLIGVAGILNVGLATVGERIEEFALRRAVGTPRLLLAGIVLTETLLTGLLTAAAAIGAGVLGLELAGPVLGDRLPMLDGVTFPWEAGAAGILAGLAAGVLGGLIPALRAARIPIATVMRA
ncbi:MAG TPA: ABC transporter permease [Pseudonocardiaceae bacterium]